MQEITRRVYGMPKAQPRPRAFAPKSGKARVYDPGTAEHWKGQVALAFQDCSDQRLSGPLEIRMTFLIARPVRLMKKSDDYGMIPHTMKPDIDNLSKAVMDTLTQIGLWEDDKQVVKITAEKYYHGKASRPGALISIAELTKPEEINV